MNALLKPRPYAVLALLFTLVVLAFVLSKLDESTERYTFRNYLSSSSVAVSSAASTSTQTSTISSVPSVGSYQDYSAAAVSAATVQRKVLFFYAAWCSSCRQQDQNLSRLRSSIPGNVAIFKVDFDKEVTLRQKYGVTLRHTFVEIDDTGKELQQWNTLYKQYDLSAILDKLK